MNRYFLPLNLTLLVPVFYIQAADHPPVVSSSKPLRQTQDKPNIIFFLADDAGYGDMGCCSFDGSVLLADSFKERCPAGKFSTFD